MGQKEREEPWMASARLQEGNSGWWGGEDWRVCILVGQAEWQVGCGE